MMMPIPAGVSTTPMQKPVLLQQQEAELRGEAGLGREIDAHEADVDGEADVVELPRHRELNVEARDGAHAERLRGRRQVERVGGVSDEAPMRTSTPGRRARSSTRAPRRRGRSRRRSRACSRAGRTIRGGAIGRAVGSRPPSVRSGIERIDAQPIASATAVSPDAASSPAATSRPRAHHHPPCSAMPPAPVPTTGETPRCAAERERVGRRRQVEDQARGRQRAARDEGDGRCGRGVQRGRRRREALRVAGRIGRAVHLGVVVVRTGDERRTSSRR